MVSCSGRATASEGRRTSLCVGVNIDIDDAKRAGEALDVAKERIARAG